jgi:hypothetical protein
LIKRNREKVMGLRLMQGGEVKFIVFDPKTQTPLGVVALPWRFNLQVCNELFEFHGLTIGY